MQIEKHQSVRRNLVRDLVALGTSQKDAETFVPRFDDDQKFSTTG